MPTGQRIQSRPQLVTDALITLTNAELRTSAFIGKSRNKKSRGAGVFDSSVADTHMIDIIGAEAELAFAKLCNLYPTDFMILDPKSKAKGTDDGDLNIDGVCVDVKTLLCDVDNVAIWGCLIRSVVEPVVTETASAI